VGVALLTQHAHRQTLIQLLVAAAAPVTFRFANKLLCNQVNSSGKGPRAAKKEKKAN